MTIRSPILAAALALASVSPVLADGLKPGQAQGIDLGAVSGVAYYTVERDGFRVVATLTQQGENAAAAPVRLEAVLAPGQSVMLSTPLGAGTAPEAVKISREADVVLVRRTTAVATN